MLEGDNDYEGGRTDEWRIQAMPNLLSAGSGEDADTDLETAKA